MATQKEINQDILGQLRAAFASGDWQKTVKIYGEMVENVKLPRGVRVEATCLAARALTAQKERSPARALLRQIGSEAYQKAIHYDFLARAYLDLRNYKEVVRCCERALEISEVEKAK